MNFNFLDIIQFHGTTDSAFPVKDIKLPSLVLSITLYALDKSPNVITDAIYFEVSSL